MFTRYLFQNIIEKKVRFIKIEKEIKNMLGNYKKYGKFSGYKITYYGKLS